MNEMLKKFYDLLENQHTTLIVQNVLFQLISSSILMAGIFLEETMWVVLMYVVVLLVVNFILIDLSLKHYRDYKDSNV